MKWLMKIARCPHCSEQAVFFWEFFVAFSNFHINGTCRNCRKPIRLNLKTIVYIIISAVSISAIGTHSLPVLLVVATFFLVLAFYEGLFKKPR